MRIFDLLMKDLTQILRDRKSLLFLVLMPVLFTLFMGFAYKSGSQSASPDQRISLGWVNQEPGGLLSEQLQTVLARSSSLKLVELPPEAAADAVRKSVVAGTLVVPAGFSSPGAGAPPQLTLIGDTNTLQGQSLFQAVRVAVTQLMSSVEIGRLVGESLGSQAEFQPAFENAMQAWAATDTSRLIKLEIAVAEPQKSWYGDNPYNQASPGILVQFAIFGLVTSGQVLVQERKLSTLQRMRTTSMPVFQVVAGHALALFCLVLMQELLLVVFGQLALGVNYAHEILGTLAVSIGLGLWIAATGLLIGLLAKNDSQVVLFSLLAMFVFSALGGTWFPLEASSGAFAAIGKLMPSAWAMAGYQNILIRGLGFESTIVPMLVLLAYALAFFALTIWLFRKAAA